jgi:two-component system, NarL family, sensor histidine kinase DesK
MDSPMNGSGRESGWVRLLLPVTAILWLGELVAPVSQVLREPVGDPRVLLALLATTVFVALYVWVALDNMRTRPAAWVAGQSHTARVWLPCAVMGVLALVMSTGYGPAWLGLFIFAGVAAAMRLTPRQAAWTIAGLLLASGAVGLVEQQSLADLAQVGLLIAGVGTSVATVRYGIHTTRELRAARAEVARLAIAEERLRFARDLHDLLGQSLSLIALKCDLTHALISSAPDQATQEVEEAASVARGALREVREAVAGYRQPSLAGELAGAQQMLAAAGIGCHLDGAGIDLPPAVESTLAWAVREGVTNVIRHSRAHTCTISMAREDGGIRLEVVDDGRGVHRPDSAHGEPVEPGGNGLAGLSERLAAAGGQCSAEALGSGGFRLRAWLPSAP